MGTELVVLSACETGLGEVRVGQGVMGLRRGFAVAGAGSLVMSLWAVGDEETAQLMERFYTELRRRDPIEALHRAQVAALAAQGDAEHPWAWAGFVASGVPSKAR